MKKSIFNTLILILFILSPVSVVAQMFSISDGQNRTSSAFTPYVKTGVYLVNFDYKGNPVALGNDNDLSFSGSAAYIGYEANALSFDLAFGNDLTQLDNRRFFNLSLSFTNPFYLIQNEKFGAGIPIKLRTKVTSVSNDGVQEEFLQTDLSTGAGVIVKTGIPDTFGLSAEFIPSIGFSTSSGGFVGGNIFSLSGKARLNFYNLLFGKNISLGYDYILDSFDIDGDQYDYDVNGHLITLGVSL